MRRLAPQRKLALFLALLTALAASFAQEETPTAADEETFAAPGLAAVYLDAEGNLVEITDEDLRPERFVFHAWLQDLEEGINLENPQSQPTQEEQTEFAPSFTQNLVAGFVGYVGEGGEVYPVAGAQVRWELDRQWGNAQGSVQFGAADAAGSVPGVDLLGIWNDQALTLTNNGGLTNQARFPVATDFPLHNATGVTTPDTSGFTWVTLFSPDQRARARVIAVASVNGVEIGKEVLIKNFAPSPQLAIEKTVNQQTLNLGADGQGTVTFTVTVRNTGQGDASNVVLQDQLTSGNRNAYSVVQGSLSEGGQGQQQQNQQQQGQQNQQGGQQGQQAQQQPSGQTGGAGQTPPNAQTGGAGQQRGGGQQGPGNDGFSRTFNLPAGASRTFTFQAQVGATDTYCNTARIARFAGEFGSSQQQDLSARACFEAIRPELAVLKDFVDEGGNSLGDNVTVTSGQQALLRVRVINRGSAPAQNVTLTDTLTSGAAQPYELVELPEGATQEGNAGFSVDVGTLEPEAARSFIFPVRATQDGEYCDTARLSVGDQQRGQDRACLRVATPQLQIEKTNDVTTVLPGTTYTSTVRVRNTGSAPARGVLLSDTVAVSGDGTVLEYESSQFNNAAGTFDKSTGVVAAATTVNIPPGGAAAFTLVTRVPVEAPAGEYCNVGRFESENAGGGEARACINVPAYAGLQNQFVDDPDPVVAGSALVYTTTLLNEPRSNEAVTNHTITYNYGVPGGQGQQQGGQQNQQQGGQQATGGFEIVSTRVFVNESPLINTETGAILSVPGSGTQLAADQDYTLQAGQQSSAQTITINRPLQPGAVLFVVHEVAVPQGTQAGEYASGFQWTPVGANSGTQYDNTAREPTTVITR